MATNVCDYLLSQDIAASCTDPVTTGLEQDGIIMNRAEIDFDAVTFDAERGNVISQLAMLAGKRAYKVRVLGNTPFTGTSTSFVAGNYQNTFTNTVQFVVLDNGPDVCESVIDALANGKFVMILENSFKALNKDKNKGDAAFQVYGYQQGLVASAIENDKYSEDSNGGWMVTMQETKVGNSGMFLYAGSYKATKAIFDSLTAAVTSTSESNE